MNKDFLKGISMALGFLLTLSVIGIVGAVGFHYAGEIFPGTFQSGNFIFDGNVNITTGNDMCIEGDKCLSGALTTETDPTVNASVNDGVSWDEITGKPIGLATEAYVNNAIANLQTQINNLGGSSPPLVLGSHTVDNCIAAGGSPNYALDVDGIFCEFLTSSCPSGWTQFKNWKKFDDTVALYYNGGCAYLTGGNACPTGSSVYCDRICIGTAFSNGGLSTRWCSYSGPGPITAYCTITKVGCY